VLLWQARGARGEGGGRSSTVHEEMLRNRCNDSVVAAYCKGLTAWLILHVLMFSCLKHRARVTRVANLCLRVGAFLAKDAIAYRRALHP